MKTPADQKSAGVRSFDGANDFPRYRREFRTSPHKFEPTRAALGAAPVNDLGELGPIQDAIAIATLWRGSTRESCAVFANEVLTEQGLELVLAQADLLLWALDFAATVINRTLAEGYEPATVEVLLQQLARSAVDAA